MASSFYPHLPAHIINRYCKRRRFSTLRSNSYSLKCVIYYFLATLFILLTFSIHFRYALLSYQHQSLTTPPRKSSLDRSKDFPIDQFSAHALYNRHTTPWFKYEDLLPPVLDTLPSHQSRNRYFMATASVDVGDGLGHRFLVVTYERYFAQHFNLTYIHRVAQYGSLTNFQPDAVDKFFGWEGIEELMTRNKFFTQICEKVGFRKATRGCLEQTVFCRRLRKGNGLVERMVEVPQQIALCMGSAIGADPHCKREVAAFAEKHTKEKTLFYTPTKLCSWKLMMSWQVLTRGWFHERYWTGNRTSRMDPRYVNVAVHVRRGDIFVGKRTVISDAAYAKLIRRMVDVVSEEELDDVNLGGEAMELRFRVHVYSQGLYEPRTRHPLLHFLTKRALFGKHDVNDFGTKYVSEKGVETLDGYWERLLGNHSRIKVDMHVSEDTLEGLEDMIAADLFVGSASGLSVHIAGQLSRGIPFLPNHTPVSLNSNKTIIWDPEGSGKAAGGRTGVDETDNSYFDVDGFRTVWREYRKHIGAVETPLGVPKGNGEGHVEARTWLREKQ